MSDMDAQKSETWQAAAKLLARRLASVQLAIVLLILLCGVLVAATWVEKSRGHDYTLWFIYRSPWFIALIGALAGNTFLALLVRFPWRGRQWCTLLAHGGVLILLFGAMQTFYYGIDGRIDFAEGEKTDSFVVNDKCRLTVGRPDSRGADNFVRFTPGPVQWPEGKSLDLGYRGEVGLKVVKYLPHAEVKEHWLADPAGTGQPAVEFALRAANDDNYTQSNWLAAGPFGSQADIGPLSVRIQKAAANSLADDFLHPPADDMDEQGVLAIHYKGKSERYPVSQNEGKRITVDDDGTAVEIVQYLPNAKTGGDGKLASAGSMPRNPRLELRVYLPDREAPLRQIAMARRPLLDMDAMRGESCPVKFWYHHPAVASEPGVEFVQTPDGKLYYRSTVSEKLAGSGEVRPGDEVMLAEQVLLKLQSHLPSARRETEFLAEETSQGGEPAAEPAIQVEVDAGGNTQTVWLRRNDQEYGAEQLDTPDGPISVAFDNDVMPLGFSLKLIDFQRGMNPGGVGDASYSSTVQLTDRAERLDGQFEIWMNHPLSHGKYMFYQSGYNSKSDGTPISTLSVSIDPGRLAKHIGSVLVCLGMLLMFIHPALGARNRSKDV
jgi:hypothetical protein